MDGDGEGAGLGWAERIQWVVDRYADGNRREFGRRIGLSGQAISAWIRGETRPSLEGLAAIVDSCPDVRPRWLLTGRGAPRVAAEDGAGPERSGGNGSSPEQRRAVERFYEAGRRDAVEEMIAMLWESARPDRV